MTSSPIKSLCEEVIRLSDKATAEPWHKSGDMHVIQTAHLTRDVWQVADCHARNASLDADLISHFRSSCPKIARALLLAVEALSQLPQYDRYYEQRLIKETMAAIAKEVGDG